MWCDVVLCDVMWCGVMWCGVMWYDVEMLLVSNSLSPVPLPTLALEDLGGREVPVNRLLLSVTLNILSGPGTVEPAEQPPATTAISELVDGQNKQQTGELATGQAAPVDCKLVKLQVSSQQTR